MTAPAVKDGRRNARVDTAIKNQARKLRENGGTPRALSLGEMKEALVATRDPDPYRDWRGAYEADIRRGHEGCRIIRTGPFTSNRTAVPRPYRRDRTPPVAT